MDRSQHRRVACAGAVAISCLLLAACGGSSSQDGNDSAATISIDSPLNGSSVDNPQVVVSGSVTPNATYRISSSSPGSGETTNTSSSGDWEQTVPLGKGENLITATVENSDGTSGVSDQIRVSFEPPDSASSEASAGSTTSSPQEQKPKKKKKKKKCVTVPDVVGENHQYAQDDMQAAGLYNLREKDATGQGRMLLWDRNWEVVSQDPSGGACVSRGTTVTLSSKKIGE